MLNVSEVLNLDAFHQRQLLWDNQGYNDGSKTEHYRTHQHESAFAAQRVGHPALKCIALRPKSPYEIGPKAMYKYLNISL